MPSGVYRRVMHIGPWALKVPRLRHFLGGVYSNRWEREMWSRWRHVFGWKTLCPILFADGAGLLVVMRWAEQPVELREIEGLPDAYPEITAETKAQDYGRLSGRVVAIDYGLPDRQLIHDQRNYYRAFLTENRPHFSGEHDV